MREPVVVIRPLFIGMVPLSSSNDVALKVDYLLEVEKVSPQPLSIWLTLQRFPRLSLFIPGEPKPDD